MPVQEKEYEIAFKNLRRREIPCLVIAVPHKNNISSHSKESGTKTTQEKTRSKILKRLKQRLNRLYSTPQKRSKSLSCLDTKSEITSKVVKKRVYRKRKLEGETSLIKQSKIGKTSSIKVSKIGDTSPMRESKIGKTTPIKESNIGETSPIKESKIGKTASIKESKIGDTSPMRESKIGKTTPIKESNIGKTSPIQESKIGETSPIKESKIGETSPIKESKISETLPITDTKIGETSSIKESKIGETLDPNETAPDSNATSSGKRPYRKKIQIQAGAIITPITGSPTSTSTDSCFGTPVISPETPKKRVYRKKLRIPAVPHNTPVVGHASDGTSISSASFLSLCSSHSGVITVGRRGRGRLPATPVKLRLENDDDSTMSQESEKVSTTRRPRRSLFGFDSDDEDEADNQVSEYELLRQKNIEENLKKLREIFSEQGLQFGEKTSETPKKRKSYSRVPLPPPRPRSQRIVVRRTFSSLDFSKLDEKLSMSDVFM